MKVTTTNWRSWICSFEGHAKKSGRHCFGHGGHNHSDCSHFGWFHMSESALKAQFVARNPQQQFSCEIFCQFPKFLYTLINSKNNFWRKMIKMRIFVGVSEGTLTHWHCLSTTPITETTQVHSPFSQCFIQKVAHWCKDISLNWQSGNLACALQRSDFPHLCVRHFTLHSMVFAQKITFCWQVFHQLIGHETAFLALFSLLVLVFHSPCLLAPWLVSRCHTNALSSLWIVLSIIVWQTIIHQNPRMTLLQKMMLPNKLLPLPGLPQRQMTLQMCSIDHLQNSWHSLCEKSNSNWIPPCLHRMSPRRCHWIMPCQWWMHNCLLLL